MCYIPTGECLINQTFAYYLLINVNKLTGLYEQVRNITINLLGGQWLSWSQNYIICI